MNSKKKEKYRLRYAVHIQIHSMSIKNIAHERLTKKNVVMKEEKERSSRRDREAQSPACKVSNYIYHRVLHCSATQLRRRGKSEPQNLNGALRRNIIFFVSLCNCMRAQKNRSIEFNFIILFFCF